MSAINVHSARETDLIIINARIFVFLEHSNDRLSNFPAITCWRQNVTSALLIYNADFIGWLRTSGNFAVGSKIFFNPLATELLTTAQSVNSNKLKDPYGILHSRCLNKYNFTSRNGSQNSFPLDVWINNPKAERQNSHAKSWHFERNNRSWNHVEEDKRPRDGLQDSTLREIQTTYLFLLCFAWIPPTAPCR